MFVKELFGMSRVDKTVLKETKYIAVATLLFSFFMHMIFVGLEKWNITVLYGNILSGVAAIANFFLMGITVQKVVNSDDKNSKNLIKLSETLRALFLFLAISLGVAFPYFDTVSVLVTIFFPRIAIIFRPLFFSDYDGEKRGDNIEKKKSDN